MAVSLICISAVVLGAMCIAGAQECPPHWKKYGDACYHTFDYRDTWDNAQRTCKSIDPRADLASVHSTEEQEVLTKLMFWQLWIGLNDFEEENVWKWNDGTEGGVLNWKEGEPNLLGEEKCGELVLGYVDWKTETVTLNNNNCASWKNFACKLESLNCPEGWEFRQGYCYFLSDFKKSWDDSRKYCKSVDPKADLVSLRNEAEATFLRDKMHWQTWIGGYLPTNEANWQWSDKSYFNYQAWDKDEPNKLEQERCVELIISNKWNNLDCSWERHFTCKISLRQNPCPNYEGWQLHGDTCYFQSRYKTDWSSARRECKDMDPRADLASVLSAEEHTVLTRTMHWELWIGLNAKISEDQYIWSDGTPVDYLVWREGEPNMLSDERCVEMIVSPVKLSDGNDTATWNNNNCNVKRHFACKLRAAICPNRWDSFNGFCYFVSNYKETWDQAQSACKSLHKNADMASIHSKEEFQYFLSRMFTRAWIGLNSISETNNWQWSDRSPVTYTFWRKDEPNSVNTERCTEVLWADNWNNNACSERYNFFCKLNIKETTAPLLPPEVTTSVMKCPAVIPKPGVLTTCFAPISEDVVPCDQPVYANYKIKYECAQFYRPTGSLPIVLSRCKPDGTWALKRPFECTPICGTPTSAEGQTSFIAGGTPTKEGAWPWHVGLYESNGTDWNYFCGGTLISERAILTAGHCVNTAQDRIEKREASSIMIGLGKYFREYISVDRRAQFSPAERIILHSNFKPYNLESDIAIIILKTPAYINAYVRPVCYPGNTGTLDLDVRLEAGTLGVLVGWGYTEEGKLSEELKMAELPVVDNDTCLADLDEGRKNFLKEDNYCVGFKNGTNSCNGDSGSGMVFSVDHGNGRRYFIQGVVSFGVVQDGTLICDPTHYSFFTRVEHFAQWIVITLSEYEY